MTVTTDQCNAAYCVRNATETLTNGTYRHNIGLTNQGHKTLATTNQVRLCTWCYAEATR